VKIGLFGMLSCVVLLSFIGCDRNEECVGVADYFLVNQNDRKLLVEVTGPGALSEKRISAPGNMRTQIGSDAIFGVNPSPVRSFDSLSIYVMTDSGAELAYTQEPINDNLWSYEILDMNSTCGARNVTLTLTNSDLTMP